MIHMDYINISCITQKYFNAAVGLIQYIHKEITNVERALSNYCNGKLTYRNTMSMNGS